MDTGMQEEKRVNGALFGTQKMTITESIRLTTESLLKDAVRFDHWVIAFSGGKDSTCCVTLVPHIINQGLVPRPKSLTVLYADTRMELPPLQASAQKVMDQLRTMGITCRTVLPKMEDRFFVYMFGRGVPPPSNRFRWCTSQIKIEPMMEAIAAVRAETGKKLLVLTGVRIGESAVRDARILLSCSRDGAECGQGWFQESTPEAVADTLAPILHWRVCRVWQWLKQWAPMAGFHTEQVADAYGGDQALEVNCRTGCVGCNLASRDAALEQIVKAPEWEYLTPLFRLRPLYAALKAPANRLRKTAKELRKDGAMVANPNRMGPLTMAARRWGMEQVTAIQDEVNAAARPAGRPEIVLINDEERAAIEGMISANIWPNGWSGTEKRADAFFEEIQQDGSIQKSLLSALGETHAAHS